MVLDPEALFSIKLSLKVATVSATLVLLIGLPLAYLLATKEFPMKNLLDTLITLPLVFPPTVTGYLLLLILGKNGVVGAILYKLLKTGVVFTWYGAVVASSVAAFPIFVKTAKSSIEAVEKNLIYAAFTLGKSELETFFRVVLPIAKRGIVAGLVLSFARAIGEFGATLMLAGNIPFKTNTIPIEIYSAVSDGNFERANVLTAVIAVLSLAIIFSVNRLTNGRRNETDGV